MRSVLLVKTSSLGDVVHNLPVVSDIRNAFPGTEIDWVLEAAFAPVASLHPGVRNVIPCRLRHWRRTWLRRATRNEWRSFATRLRSTQYDCIIDTQGLLKSALIARAAIGRRVGLDWKSSREPLRVLYDQVYNVPWGGHAVERNRRLAALALGYEVLGDPVYGIRARPLAAPWLPPGPYVVLFHATSQARKLWPEADWIELGERLAHAGLVSVLPWGEDEERLRARRLASRIPAASVAPKLDLHQLSGTIAGCRAAVGVDTGLTHLAAALGVPAVGIYGATEPNATGIYAAGPVANVGNAGRFPSVDEAMAALDAFGVLRTTRYGV